MWLLKPTHLNRGRGIHVFNDLPTLHRLIREYCLGKDEEGWKKKDQELNGNARKEDQKENENKDEEEYPPEEPDADGLSPEKLTSKSSPGKRSKLFKIKHNDFVI